MVQSTQLTYFITGKTMPTLEEILSNSQSRVKLKDLLDRIEFNAQLTTNKTGYETVTSGGGRVGYRQPLENGSFTAGVSGGGYKVDVNAPQFKFKNKDFRVTGVDATYENGNNTFGVDFQDKNNFMLNYGRKF